MAFKDPLKRKEWLLQHHEKNKEDDRYRLSITLKQLKQRAKRKGLEWGLDIDSMVDLMPKDNLCPILRIPLFWGIDGPGANPNSPSVDRIDTQAGYTLDNIQIISWRANRLKNDASFEELEAIVDYLRQYQ